jgi:predicted RNA binding protein YcfA (HicA-like mRNA interferase family)
MAQWQKILDRILSGKADANIRFSDLCGLLVYLGFRERIEGSHHVFVKQGVFGRVVIQPLPNGKAKAYHPKW